MGQFTDITYWRIYRHDLDNRYRYIGFANIGRYRYANPGRVHKHPRHYSPSHIMLLLPLLWSQTLTSTFWFWGHIKPQDSFLGVKMTPESKCRGPSFQPPSREITRLVASVHLGLWKLPNDTWNSVQHLCVFVSNQGRLQSGSICDYHTFNWGQNNGNRTMMKDEL